MFRGKLSKRWVNRRRGDWPVMTQHMLHVLQDMRAAHEAGWKVVGMAGGRSRHALLQRGWIAESPGLDGTKYYLTHLGRQALAVYEAPPPYRYDGLCPDCGQRQRYISPNGTDMGYCRQCQRQRQQYYYRRGQARKLRRILEAHHVR